MSENVSVFQRGTVTVTVTGKISITYAEVRELRSLFDHVAEISAGERGPMPPPPNFFGPNHLSPNIAQ